MEVRPIYSLLSHHSIFPMYPPPAMRNTILAFIALSTLVSAQTACVPTTDYGDGTGESPTCSAIGEVCVDYTCQPYKQNGEQCSSYIQCPGSSCLRGVCGAYDESCQSNSDCLYGCVVSFSGVGKCAFVGGSSYCDSSQTDYCGDGTSCSPDDMCGGPGASCFPDSYSSDNTGASSGCGSAISCYSGTCQIPGSGAVGSICRAGTDCGKDLHCTFGQCSSDATAVTGNDCGPGITCVDDGTSCINGQCAVDPNGGSIKPRKREEKQQLPWVYAACPRAGEVACPTSDARLTKAYEVSTCVVESEASETDYSASTPPPTSSLVEDASMDEQRRVWIALRSRMRIWCRVKRASVSSVSSSNLGRTDMADSCNEGFQFVAANQTCVAVEP